MPGLLRQRPDLLPSLGVFAAACGWGLFWIPMRALDEAGIDGAWAPFSIYVAGTALLLPIALVRWRKLRAGGIPLVITGLASGGTFALYLNALLLTDVVRALLLFYLAPVWSTILQAIYLKEPITARHGLVIALGLGGLVVMLGFEGGFPLPRNLGDWLALLGGVFMAISAVRIRAQTHIHTHESNFAFYAAGGLFAFGLAFLPFEAMGEFPDSAAMLDVLPWLLLVLAVFVVPANYFIIYGAARISPSRISILLMAEVVTGILSAASLTDEPFGLREAAGSVLIGAAGLVEVLRRERAAAPTG